MKRKVTVLCLAIAGALALAGCGSTLAVKDVLTSANPSAESCAAVANLGERAISAGEKTETAQSVAIAATPLTAVSGKVATGLGVVLAGGKGIYETVDEAWQEKCPQALGGEPAGGD